MKKSISRRITKTASVMLIMVLLIGGTIYLRTVFNAESLDNRNLRELSRIGQGVEGRINNLRRVLKNLAGNSKEDVIKKAKLIPYLNLSVDTTLSQNTSIENLTSAKIALKTDLTSQSFKPWQTYDSSSIAGDSTLLAEYNFKSLRPTLSSEYMETIFLSNDKGSIFIWETDRTGVRIHELAALDTLQFKEGSETVGVGKSDIIQTTIAGQDYRLYLLPIRVHFSAIEDNIVSESDYTKWILGGLVPVSDYQQQSLSLDPNMALFLGFLVIAGFLLVPFIRILTMGPKERLKVGNLFYLVIALIFGSGLAGLWMADLVHFSPLKEDVKIQMKKTANQMAINIDQELQLAIGELDTTTTLLDNYLSKGDLTIFDINKSSDIDTKSYLMKEQISFDPSKTYPFFHMVFWTDSDGEQLAKWTPRGNNTPLINVGQREYFKAIHENRSWVQKFHTNPDSSTCSNMEVPNTDSLTNYYIESIRSWNTGENLAAISIPWNYTDNTGAEKKGIAAITTKLASLTTPVLPPGVGFAVVDTDAQTLFHTRSERILDENFAEETSNGDLLRSILAARSCTELEMSYEGQNKLMAIRPLNGRPLFLILFKDLSLIDTVRFEAWFEGGALFGLWALLILLLIYFLERLPSSRMDWLWPDLEKPGKYIVFTLYSLPFIILFIINTFMAENLHIHAATLVIPALYFSLGLVIISHGISSYSSRFKTTLGWAMFAVSMLLVGWLTIQNSLETTQNELIAIFISLTIVVVWLWFPKLQAYIREWSIYLSPRGAYATAMMSGLLVLGLLPGYLAYRFTFHDHSEHLVKYHQLELSESLNNRKTRFNELLQDNWNVVPSWNEKGFLEVLSGVTYDQAFENLIFRTKLQEKLNIDEENDPNINTDDLNSTQTDLHDSMHGLLGNHIPFLTDASVRMRQLSSDQADRSWVPDTSGRLLLLLGDKEKLLTSELPIAGSWLIPFRIAILLTSIGLLYLIVYRVGRWVFFVHLEHSEPLSLEDVLPKPGESWRSTILVGTRSIPREPLRKRNPEIHYIDLITDVEKTDDIKNLLNKPLPDGTKVLCLDYFDHRIDEKERNLAMLEFLEKNGTPNNTLPLLLMTSREPVESLLTANIPEEKKDVIKHRWDRVLGRFSKMILSDFVPDDNFRTLLQFRIVQKIADDLDELLIKLNAYVRDINTAENRSLYNESLAILTLKTKWLGEKLEELNSQKIVLTQEQKYLAGNVNRRLEKILNEFGNLKILVKDTEIVAGKYFERLSKPEDSAGEVDNPIYQTARGRHGKMTLLGKMPIGVFKGPSMKARRMVEQDKKKIQRVCQTLLEECGNHLRLQEIGEQVTSRPSWYTLNKDEIIDLVREGADSCYRSRWAILSEGEQLVAAQLSRGAVVNPKSRQAVSRLFARRLIRKSPELVLHNNSFSDFVRNTVSEDQLQSWEHAGIPSTWEMIRAPLVIALIIVALFLFWSQREFMGNTIAFLGTIGVGVGAIFNLLSKFSSITGSSDTGNSGK